MTHPINNPSPGGPGRPPQPPPRDPFLPGIVQALALGALVLLYLAAVTWPAPRPSGEGRWYRPATEAERRRYDADRLLADLAEQQARRTQSPATRPESGTAAPVDVAAVPGRVSPEVTR